MKKVVLLGDSIRLIGYGTLVPSLLGEDYEVWQPEDNCRFASYTLRMLYDYRAFIEGADIIHWNNGLWDVCDLFADGAFTPIDVYVQNLVRIAKLLKTYSNTVIFATTTPPDSEMPGHTLERIQEYNRAACEALEPLGIIINDIYPIVAENIPEMICSDHIHLSEAGIREVSARIASVITDNC